MKTTALLPALLLVTGCAIDHISPEHPETLLPDRSAVVVPGHSTRDAVRNALGPPQLASRYWRFDLFRADTTQHDTVIAITPWPIPFARIEDSIQRLTLVAYDASGHADAVASGLLRRPAAWRSASPIRNDFQAILLRADGLLLVATPEGGRDPSLLATPARRDAHLAHAATSAGCTAVIGCGGPGCPDRLAVDAGAPRRLPLRSGSTYWIKPEEKDWLNGIADAGTAAWLETLVALPLAAGPHALEFSASRLGGQHRLDFTCQPGEVAYLTISAADNGKLVGRALEGWQAHRSATPPTAFARRPLVLVDDASWYVEAEPGD